MKKLFSVFQSLIAFFLSILVVAPFAIIILNSFKTKKEASEMNFKLPIQWNLLNNYEEVFKTGILRAFFNSCGVTFLALILILITSALTAFILQRRESGFTKRLTTFFVIGLILPGQIIPTYMICDFLHLKGFLGAAIVLAAANIPLGVFMYIGYLKSISISIDEAAIVDGCNTFQLFFKVIVPLLKPMTVTLFIINFMGIWNDFGTTIYFLNNSQNYTLTLTIYNFFGAHGSDWNLVFANVVLVSLPVILIYFTAQKHIMSGMTSGAVKG